MAKDESGIGKQGGGRGAKIRQVSDGGPKLARGRGKIEIGKYNTSKWTKKTYVNVILFLSIPYCAMLYALYTAGLVFLAVILLGVSVLCGILVAVAYWVDKADF
jgi:hypothetical protein